MPALTQQFLFDFESKMSTITESEYARLVKALWWQKIAKVRPSDSRQEVVAWLLDTAMIRPTGKGGNIDYAEIVELLTTYTSNHAGNGLKLVRDQLEDADGKGLDYAAQWSTGMGAYMAYWPQKQVAKAVLNGETGVAYDKKPFFSGWDAAAHTGKHPYNPYALGLGGYANIFSGAADTGAGYNYPGACPIDDSVTVDVAIINLSKAISYIGGIKMPNGEDPRMLVPRGLIVPPRMTPRAQLLANAKTIALPATGGAGSADITAIISNWGFQQPLEVQEFGANFKYTMNDGTVVQGDDQTSYLLVEQITNSQLGALVYVEREAFHIKYYTGQGGGTGVDAILDRANELEWHVDGRNDTSYGHPYLLFKLKPT